MSYRGGHPEGNYGNRRRGQRGFRGHGGKHGKQGDSDTLKREREYEISIILVLAKEAGRKQTPKQRLQEVENLTRIR